MAPDLPHITSKSMILRNEFSVVHVSIERVNQSHILTIFSTITGKAVNLDPLELEAMTRIEKDVLRKALLTEWSIPS